MNQDLAWMLLRSLLLVGSGYLVGKNFLTDEQAATLIGAAGVIFTIGWQAWVRWNTKSVSEKVIDDAKADPSVPNIPTLSAATGGAS